MQLRSIDHVILPVPSLATAAQPWQRLGLNLTSPMRHAGPTENQVGFIGADDTEFYVELLSTYDESRARAENPALVAAMERGGLSRLMLSTDDVAGVVAAFEAAGAPFTQREVHRETGQLICTVVDIADVPAGCTLSIVQYATPAAERIARHNAAGYFEHEFPLLRLDHLAIIAPALDTVEAFWNNVLGVATVGEVRGRGMVIRQLRIGDAIVELIGPDGADSPLAAAPGGLISMVAFEVADLDFAVTLARARFFDLPDAAVGVLPNSRVSTISGDQLGGVALQMIEFTG